MLPRRRRNFSGGRDGVSRRWRFGLVSRRDDSLHILTGAAMIKIPIESVNLPKSAIRVVDPEFCLPRVTALDPFLTPRTDARPFEALLHRHERGGAGHAEAE